MHLDGILAVSPGGLTQGEVGWRSKELRTEARALRASRKTREETDGEQPGGGRENKGVWCPGDVEKNTLPDGGSGRRSSGPLKDHVR